MYRFGIVSALALALFGSGAAAATIGSFTFDDTAFADDAVIVSTSGVAAEFPGEAADGDFTTASNLNDSFLELIFTDNVLINGAGDDLVIFGGSNNNVIRLYSVLGSTPTWITGTETFIPAGATGNTSGFLMNAATFDLSALGIASGATFSDGLYIARGGVFSTVWDVAALNSGAATPAVPLPPGLPMALSGLALFGVARRLRR